MSPLSTYLDLPRSTEQAFIFYRCPSADAGVAKEMTPHPAVNANAPGTRFPIAGRSGSTPITWNSQESP